MKRVQSSYFPLGYQVDEVGIEDDLDAWNGPNFPSGKTSSILLLLKLSLLILHFL